MAVKGGESYYARKTQSKQRLGGLNMYILVGNCGYIGVAPESGISVGRGRNEGRNGNWSPL